MLLVPNYSKGNISGLKSELQKINWQTVLTSNNVEHMCTIFTNILLEVEDKWIPKVRRRINGTKKPQWMTNDIRLLINRKKRFYKNYKQSKSHDDFLRYIVIKRHCEREIRKAKRNLEINISQQSKTNPKKFFQYIRSKKTVKEKIGPIKDAHNRLVSDCKNMAVILNSFFIACLSPRTFHHCRA